MSRSFNVLPLPTTVHHKPVIQLLSAAATPSPYQEIVKSNPKVGIGTRELHMSQTKQVLAISLPDW